MKVTAASLHERYSSMNTEALADLYHGGLTDLAVSVLKDVITSRGLDWAQFTKPESSTTEPEQGSDWSLWRSEPRQVVTDETKDDSQHKSTGLENHAVFASRKKRVFVTTLILLVLLLGSYWLGRVGVDPQELLSILQMMR
jgi:hypothetical protein